MNALIEFLNSWGDRCFDFAVPMLWQSSLLIAIVFLVDFAMRRKMRAALRYALWMVVLVKLVLPPTLASPSAVSWWLRPNQVAIASPQKKTVIVRYSDVSTPAPSLPPMEYVAPPPPKLSWQGTVLLSAVGIGALLFGWMAWRWWQISRTLRATALPSDELTLLLTEVQKTVGLRTSVEIRVTSQAMSPAVCGLLRPVVLLPACLTERLYPEQLRAVLLHELTHLKRRDVWMNCVQTLLQILYWWHPLLWIANARIRRVREEAVDDAVMLALQAEAEIYAPTLLEVAKLAFSRPLASLGIVGILESKNALRQRIERLLNFTTPRKAGLSVLSLLAIAAFSAIAVPMGEAPAATTNSSAVNEQPAQSAAGLVQDGRLLYQLGKLDEAAEKLRRALEINPANASALYYSNLVREAQIGKTNPPVSEFHLLPYKLPDTETKTIRVNPGPPAIAGKLSTIRLDSAQFDGLSLPEALLLLSSQTKKADPEKQGINFMLHPSATTDVASIKIHIKQRLTNAPLSDILNLIFSGADKPIGYSVLDHAIEFFVKEYDTKLVSRTFNVDTETVLRMAGHPTRQPGETATAAIQNALRDFFSKNGIDMTPPKSFFFNDRQSRMFVRATSQDLDLIETAFFVLKQPQINIKAKFMEVDSDGWVATLFLLNATNTVITSAQSFTRILDESQYNKVLKELNRRKNCDLLYQGEITTLNGREAQLRIGDSKTIVINNDTSETTNMFFGLSWVSCRRSRSDRMARRLFLT